MVVDKRDPIKLYHQIKELQQYRKISFVEAHDLIEEKRKAEANGTHK